MRAAHGLAAAALAGWLLVGCALPLAGPAGRGTLRVSEVASEGDPARRASLRLVSEGLASDDASQPRLALSQYERAIQIDPNNPYAYLAIARHYTDAGLGDRALEFLDQAELLLDAEELRSPGVEPHLLGLRGAALAASGRGDEAEPLLSRARDLAPAVWDDSRLDADELR
jgi:tetratricopeptide (TPR) repeat protein